ncbi:MCP four helix bundle domain-containing protein [Priestia aryabhattai]
MLWGITKSEYLSKDENYQRKRLDETQEKEAENNKLMAQCEKTFMLDNEKEKLNVYKENISNLTQARSEVIQLAQGEKGDEAYNVFLNKSSPCVQPYTTR